ncbi:MAG: HEAT repeat domain-containing protein, partial [Egibacteraceae bacterium]
PLLQRLDDDEVDVRRTVGAALGRLGDARAVEPLLACLDDVNANVRAAAAQALGRLGDERAVAPLIDCSRSGGHGLREAAVIALGRLGTPQALTVLHDLLTATVRDTRLWALEGLSHTCDGETDRKLLTKNVDGLQPFLDPRLPIGDTHLRRAARALNLPEQDIQHRYTHLAQRLPLTLSWNNT